MIDNTRHTLETQIAQLYEAFSAYTVHHPIAGSPISITKEMQDELASKSLREITGRELDRFTFSAMSTWGDTNDFKHYVPRILEVLAFESHSFGLVWPGLIFDKLDDAGLFDQPESEQQSIRAYLKALWDYILEIYPSRSISVGEFLEGVRDVDTYLATWQGKQTEISPLYHLVDLTQDRFNILNRGFGIISHTPETMLIWLQNPDKQLLLERAFFECKDDILSEQISLALENLKLLSSNI